MKVKLFRQSGDIVDKDRREAYNAEWQQVYDRIEKKAEAIYNKKSGKLQLVPAMIVMQRLTRYAERQLFKKHAIDVEIELPKSKKAMSALIKKYDDVPIMLARTQDGTDVIAILMDALNS